VLDGTENGLSSRNPFLTIYYLSALFFLTNHSHSKLPLRFVLDGTENGLSSRNPFLTIYYLSAPVFFPKHSHSKLPLCFVLDGTENGLSSRKPFLTILYYPSAPVFSQKTAIVNYHFVLCRMEQKMAYRVETLFSQSIIYQRLFFHKTQP
jgi:hypothetical protein